MDRRFRLQSVLNYRQDLEEALLLELGRLRGEEHAAREYLTALRAESERAMAAMRDMQQQPRPDVGALVQGFVYLDALQELIGRQIEAVARAAEAVEAKRLEVIAAMQDRKVLDKLKQRHDRAYAEWARRTEERAVDDIVTARHNRRMTATEETGA